MIDKFIRQGEWQKARSLILQQLEENPDDHWLLTRLSTTYYEEHHYDEALRISEKALKISPKCPLVLWDYAGALDMLGKHEDAIKIWRKLIKKGVNKIAYSECGEGIRWARSLINDSKYRTAISYLKMGMLSNANKYLRDHLKHRAPGIPSIYRLSDVKKLFMDIQNKLKHKSQ